MPPQEGLYVLNIKFLNMNILKIGIVSFDQKGKELIAEAFEEALMEEICNKTLYETQGEDAIDEALKDWEDGKTDAILVVPAEGEEKLNPASLRGLDMLLWHNLRMAFANEEEDMQTQIQMLQEVMRRDFDIDKPRITPIFTPEHLEAYDVVMVTDRSEGLKDFLAFTGGNGVAFTTGRELVCISPFSEESFFESIFVAKDIIAARERFDEARKNPLPKLFVDKKEEHRRHEPDRQG
jgi:hypothetical protein